MWPWWPGAIRFRRTPYTLGEPVRRRNGSVSALPKAKVMRLKELEERLKQVSIENERLKRLLAEKELELPILRELKERVNPR